MISCLVLSDLVHSDQFLEKNCSIRNSQNRIDKTLPHVVNPQTQKMFRILTEQNIFHTPAHVIRQNGKLSYLYRLSLCVASRNTASTVTQRFR